MVELVLSLRSPLLCISGLYCALFWPKVVFLSWSTEPVLPFPRRMFSFPSYPLPSIQNQTNLNLIFCLVVPRARYAAAGQGRHLLQVRPPKPSAGFPRHHKVGDRGQGDRGQEKLQNHSLPPPTRQCCHDGLPVPILFRGYQHATKIIERFHVFVTELGLHIL